MNLDQIYAPIKHDLQNVEERLRTIVVSEVYPIRELYNHVLSSGGKRIRPALVLLSAKSLDYSSPKVMDLACAVELIHMASLIHDDVIDSAKLRRGKPAAHAIWGTEIAVTIGDYLFSQAMECLTACEDHEVIKIFSKAVKRMAAGELLQTANRRDTKLTEEEYIHIVSGKTASLISASCESAAKIASADLAGGSAGIPARNNNSIPARNSIQNALAQYGLDFGISYQIVDDVLDLTSTDDQLGKPVMNSIREGNMTLPIIHALKNHNGEFRERLVSLLFSEQIDYMEMQEVIDSITNADSLLYTQDVAKMYAENAKRRLAVLKDSAAKQSLVSFADFIVEAGPVPAHTASSTQYPASIEFSGGN